MLKTVKIDNKIKEVVMKSKMVGFRVLVNYDLSIRGSIVAGKYDEIWRFGKNYKDFDPEKNLECPKSKRTGQSEIEIKLFHFDKEMTLKQVISKMKKEGYRSADITELLAFGAQYPDEQNKYPIIAPEIRSYVDKDFADETVELTAHGLKRILSLSKCEKSTEHRYESDRYKNCMPHDDDDGDEDDVTVYWTKEDLKWSTDYRFLGVRGK
jgi:hypothetical protein